jgi:anti-anti-sigma regulatory factor
LAAETETRTNVETELAKTIAGWEQTQQQLAAETETRTNVETELAKTMEGWEQTQQQLAAETETRTNVETELAETIGAWEQTQQQLAVMTEEQTQLRQQLQEFEETISRLQQQIEDERQLAKQQLIDTEKRTIRELPLSIIPLMDQIVVIPLIGPIDATRAKDIIDTLSPRLARFQPKVIFLDITGVSEMNDEVAGHLTEITEVMETQGVQATLIGQPMAEEV